MTATEPTAVSARSRREVLCGLMVALVAPGAVVAACSDASGPASGSTAPSGGQSGGSGALAAVADIPDGGGVVIPSSAKGPVVLVRTGDEVKAFGAACPHMGTVVDAPKDGVITCPNHGSAFDAASGALKKGPATNGLREVPVTVADGKVQLA